MQEFLVMDWYKRAHTEPGAFLHPKDFNGILIELEQVSVGGME